MNARLAAVGILAAGALLAGCQSTVSGQPRGVAGGPTASPSLTTPTAANPPSAEALPPQNGYVFITTKSGQTRCQISATDVGCEAPFTHPPTVRGVPANGVRVTAAGKVEWISGNLGDIPVVTIDYRTYSAQGWTIVATEAGTRFTNDGTRHGMFVAIGGVEVF